MSQWSYKPRHKVNIILRDKFNINHNGIKSQNKYPHTNVCIQNTSFVNNCTFPETNIVFISKKHENKIITTEGL